MADMQKIREELEYLMGEDPEGKLHAKAVWEYGRDFNGEIGVWMTEQGVFDPEVAQEKLGLILARQLIIRVKVTIDRKEPEPPIRIREYQSLSGDRYNGGGYRSVRAVMADDDLRNELLATAKRELQTIRIRYGQLSELAPVFAAIDNTFMDGEAATEEAATAP